MYNSGWFSLVLSSAEKRHQKSQATVAVTYKDMTPVLPILFSHCDMIRSEVEEFLSCLRYDISSVDNLNRCACQ